MLAELNLRPPSMAKQVLERVGLRAVIPADLCLDERTRGALYSRYPDLFGDPRTIAIDCYHEGWRVPGWWKPLVRRKPVF